MKILSPWRKKPRDKFRIISLYKIESTALRNTTWEEKNSLFLFTYCFLPHYVFSLTLSIFLSSFACSHSSSSSRLHLVLTTLWDFTSFSPLPKWPNGLYLYFFIFTSFLPFTLFSSSNASHLLWLCFNQNLLFQLSLAEWPCLFFSLFFSSAIAEWLLLLLLSFLSSFSMLDTPKPTTPITHGDFCT